MWCAFQGLPLSCPSVRGKITNPGNLETLTNLHMKLGFIRIIFAGYSRACARIPVRAPLRVSYTYFRVPLFMGDPVRVPVEVPFKGSLEGALKGSIRQKLSSDSHWLLKRHDPVESPWQTTTTVLRITVSVTASLSYTVTTTATIISAVKNSFHYYYEKDDDY